jgi:hypothetical protein
MATFPSDGLLQLKKMTKIETAPFVYFWDVERAATFDKQPISSHGSAFFNWPILENIGFLSATRMKHRPAQSAIFHFFGAVTMKNDSIIFAPARANIASAN